MARETEKILMRFRPGTRAHLRRLARQKSRAKGRPVSGAGCVTVTEVVRDAVRSHINANPPTRPGAVPVYWELPHIATNLPPKG